MGTEYGIGTGTEQGLGIAAVDTDRSRIAEADANGFSEREMRNYIAEECDRITEWLLPTMAVNGDAVHDRILADPLMRARELSETRNLKIRNLDYDFKSSKQVWSLMMLAAVVCFCLSATSGIGPALFAGGVAGIGAILLRQMLGINGTRTLIQMHQTESVDDAYGRFRLSLGDLPSRPDVLLLGRKGLLFKTAQGVPRFVDYSHVTSIFRKSQEVVSVSVNGEIALHLDANVPGPDVLNKLLNKVAQAKGHIGGEAST